MYYNIREIYIKAMNGNITYNIEGVLLYNSTLSTLKDDNGLIGKLLMLIFIWLRNKAN